MRTWIDAYGKNSENDLPAGCFTAGTPVLTEKGTKAIEEIQAGDYVPAEDLESGRQEYKKVVRTTVPMAEKLQLFDEVKLLDGTHSLEVF